MKKKRIILFYFLFLILLGCKPSVQEETPLVNASNLVTSFVKLDTTLFYSAVSIDSLVSHIRKKDTTAYEGYQIRILLFLTCGPWKISASDRDFRRSHPFPFSHFELSGLRKEGDVIYSTVRWSEINKSSVRSLNLTFYEQKPKIWKIKAIDFPKSDSLSLFPWIITH